MALTDVYQTMSELKLLPERKQQVLNPDMTAFLAGLVHLLDLKIRPISDGSFQTLLELAKKDTVFGAYDIVQVTKEEEPTLQSWEESGSISSIHSADASVIFYLSVEPKDEDRGTLHWLSSWAMRS